MSTNLDRLLDIMARLRDPETGCPWDVEQTFSTIAPYTIEEAYEVADAIEKGDMDDLRQELGDLLLQVVFHARIAEEAEHFSFDDVAEAIADKLIRRHPHVFGDVEIRDSTALRALWETQKATERQQKSQADGVTGSVLDNVPVSLPALTRSVKLQRRAVSVGFDWDRPDHVLDKVEEEIAELREALSAETLDMDHVEEEIGDVFFTVSNFARFIGVDPEAALRGCNTKFERRFRHMETTLAADGIEFGEADISELERRWIAAKQAERTKT